MGTVDIAAERAASQERRARREQERYDSWTPWMKYVWFLFQLYPSNPVSFLFLDTLASTKTYRTRQQFSDGTYGGAREGGEDYSEARGAFWVTRVESQRQFDSRTSRASDNVEAFLRGLPEEHTYEAWLATQED